MQPPLVLRAEAGAARDRVACARWMESLGVDFIIHHIGYDERRMITGLSPMDEIDEVVRAVSIPVQAVGGLTIPQAIECPTRGAPLVVLGAPLVIDAEEFKAASGKRLHDVLSQICRDIRQSNRFTGDQETGRNQFKRKPDFSRSPELLHLLNSALQKKSSSPDLLVSCKRQAVKSASPWRETNHLDEVMPRRDEGQRQR